jgi:hypothetical protein
MLVETGANMYYSEVYDCYESEEQAEDVCNELRNKSGYNCYVSFRNEGLPSYREF